MIKKTILSILKFYMKFISPLTGPSCRFYPTCSDYGYQAIEKFGVAKGTYLAVRRILCCHPWHPGGFDPIPACDSDSRGGDMLHPQGGFDPIPACNSNKQPNQQNSEPKPSATTAKINFTQKC